MLTSKQMNYAIAVLLTLFVGNANSEETGFVELLVPPELIMQHRAEIQISSDQLQQIGKITNEFSQRAESGKRVIEKHNQELVRLLKSESIEEVLALKELQSYLTAEQKLKQLHFTAMLRIRNVLTDAQRTTLIAKRKSMSRDAMKSGQRESKTEQRLRAKVERIKKEVESRVSSGSPPMEAAKLMQGFSELMQKGRVDDAEAILDRVMRMLQLQPEGKVPRSPNTDGAMLPQRPRAIARLAQMPKLSFAELRKSVSDLHVDDIAWRQIPWETCLINGLQRSRAERKPLVLWVFIDRPIDDERC